MTSEPDDTHERYATTLREIIARKKWPGAWIARVLLHRHEAGRSKAADMLWARIERARKSLRPISGVGLTVSEFERGAIVLLEAGFTADDVARCMKAFHAAGLIITERDGG